MLLREKEALFRSGKLTASRDLSRETIDAAELGKLTPAFRQILFEKTASMAAEIIAVPRSSFVGANSYMNNLGYLRSNVFIGRYCSIGRRVTIGAGGHWMSGISTSPVLPSGPVQNNYTPDEMAELSLSEDVLGAHHTVIQSDVWIGDGVIIKPGVTLGTGSVVGANSVVLRDIAPYEVVGGVPARHIRSRFPQELCDDILRSEWWEYPVNTLKTLRTGNVRHFLDDLKALNPADRDIFHTFSFSG